MSEELKLPNNWVNTTLTDIGKVVSGGTPSTKENSYWGGNISWISPSDLTGYSDVYITKGAKSITQEGLKNSSATLMPAGSIHFSSRAPIGYTVISSGEMTTNQGFKSVIPAKGIFNEYIYYYLKSAKQLAEAEATGTTFKEISGTAFSKLPIPIPPTLEQHRIVAKIEELFSELDKGIENLKTARAQTMVYRQALLKQAFEGKMLVRKGIISEPFSEDSILTLGDIIQTLGQGWSPRCLETPSQSDDIWGVIRTTAIQPFHFDDTKNKQLPKDLVPRPHLEICSGDILITRAGPRNRVGIACYVKNTRRRLMVCDKAYRIQVSKEKVLPQYLVMLLNTSELLSELEKFKSGISDSGLNLTQDKFMTLRVKVPSLEHQQLIIDDVEEKMTNLGFFETQIENSLQKSEALRQSILKKAFSGALVTQDVNDEPASVLLARIKAEKALQAVATKPRKTKKAQALPEPVKTNVIPFPVKIPNISATDLHAGIIARAYQLHENSKRLDYYGHVKAEKISHLVEGHLGIDLERIPFKDAAGPNDYPHLKKVESRARKAGWFEVRQAQKDGAYVFSRLNGFDALVNKTANILGDRLSEVDALLKLLLPMNTRQAEIVATLYAGWNNLLLLGQTPSDDEIVYESRENWHTDKLNIERDRFFKALVWMREHQLVPMGKGRYVKNKE